jgi:hypothetical protein
MDIKKWVFLIVPYFKENKVCVGHYSYNEKQYEMAVHHDSLNKGP